MKESEYVMEIEIEYRVSVNLLGVTRETRNTTNVKVSYNAYNSIDAISLMRDDVAQDIRNGLDIISYHIVAFVKEDV